MRTFFRHSHVLSVSSPSPSPLLSSFYVGQATAASSTLSASPIAFKWSLAGNLSECSVQPVTLCLIYYFTNKKQENNTIRPFAQLCPRAKKERKRNGDANQEDCYEAASSQYIIERLYIIWMCVYVFTENNSHKRNIVMINTSSGLRVGKGKI